VDGAASRSVDQRRITPQKPRSVPRERDEEQIRHWLRYRWPRLKNGLGSFARISFSWTKAVA
jgi:hypothetical protein